jgi:hypothetical protein
LAGPESEAIQDDGESSISVPNLGQSNDSNSANDPNPDPNALIGLDALLQVLQNANASDVVSPSSPDSFDFSRSPPQFNQNAVQVAATALNQLSQQEAQDGYYPFAGMVLSVCSLFPQCCTIYSSVTPSRLQFRGFRNPPPLSQHHFPNQKITTFLLSYYFDRSSAHWLCPVIHRPSFENFYRTFSSGELPPTFEFVALLSITCAIALQFLPESDDDVRSPIRFIPSGRLYLRNEIGCSVRRLCTREESPGEAFSGFLAFHAIQLHRISVFVI